MNKEKQVNNERSKGHLKTKLQTTIRMLKSVSKLSCRKIRDFVKLLRNFHKIEIYSYNYYNNIILEIKSKIFTLIISLLISGLIHGIV